MKILIVDFFQMGEVKRFSIDTVLTEEYPGRAKIFPFMHSFPFSSPYASTYLFLEYKSNTDIAWKYNLFGEYSCILDNRCIG